MAYILAGAAIMLVGVLIGSTVTIVSIKANEEL